MPEAQCPVCDSKIPPGATNCPDCGTPTSFVGDGGKTPVQDAPSISPQDEDILAGLDAKSPTLSDAETGSAVDDDIMAGLDAKPPAPSDAEADPGVDDDIMAGLDSKPPAPSDAETGSGVDDDIMAGLDAKPHAPVDAEAGADDDILAGNEATPKESEHSKEEQPEPPMEPTTTPESPPVMEAPGSVSTAEIVCPMCNTQVSEDDPSCPGCGAQFAQGVIDMDSDMFSASIEGRSAEPDATSPSTAVSPDTDISQAPEAEVTTTETPADGMVSSPDMATSSPDIPEDPAEQGSETEAEAIAQPGGIAEPEAIAQPEPVVAPKEKPKTDKELFKELAGLVREVKPLLISAKKFGASIVSSKKLIDLAIVAGKKKDYRKAIELVLESKESTHTAMAEHVQEMIDRANKRLEEANKEGQDTTDANVAIQNANEMLAEQDYKGAMGHARVALERASPPSGPQMDAVGTIKKVEGLVANCEAVGLDVTKSRFLIGQSTSSMDAGDWEKALEYAQQANEDLIKELPDILSDLISSTRPALKKAKIEGKDISKSVRLLKDAKLAIRSADYKGAIDSIKEYTSHMQSSG